MSKPKQDFKVPNYLLKTSFGEKLQQKLSTSKITVEQDTEIARLSALGVMGSMPSRYIESGYDSELVEMLNRSSAANTHNDTEQNTEEDEFRSIHYSHDVMDIDVIDDEDDEQQYGEEEDLDELSNRSLPLRRRSSRKESRLNSLSIGGSNVVKYPLPTRWIPTSNGSLQLSQDGLDLKIEASDHHYGVNTAKNYDYYVTRADSSIPLKVGVFYFEVAVKSVTNSNIVGACDISIGVMNAESSTVSKMPGLEPGSFGYSGNDGKICANQSSVTRNYSRKFGLDDVIGCGVNFSKKVIFFTKNGVDLGVAFHDVAFDVIPIIGLRNGNSLTTNFGQNSEFLFDINGYIAQEKIKIQKKIFNSTNIDNSDTENDTDVKKVNRYTDKEIPNLLQRLVGAYFEHLGYVDISKVFREEVLEEQVAQDQQSVLDFDEVNLEIRQQIRKFIMSGDIDSGISLTNAKFPEVLKNNEEIFFKLQCNKFIQLIKQENVDKAMEFGQYLKSKFSEIGKFQDFLNDIFSLIAFENPNDSEFGYLLNNDQLYKLSDELNSEILKNLGKSSVSNLESFLKHNQKLLNELNEQNQLDSLLITNQDFKL